MNDNGHTRVVNQSEINSEIQKAIKYKETFLDVYDALCEKGYDPISQIIGFLFSEDPTYITNHNGARIKMQRIDRYEAMKYILKEYISKR